MATVVETRTNAETLNDEKAVSTVNAVCSVSKVPMSLSVAYSSPCKFNY